MLELSLCITNYNRTDMLVESFSKVIDDPRIKYVAIVDDGSDKPTTDYILSHDAFNHPKIVLCFNTDNLGMLQNKIKAIHYSPTEWCIIFDSDNIIDTGYLDAIDREIEFAGGLIEDIIYCPSFAAPSFDYTPFQKELFSTDLSSGRRAFNKHKDHPMFESLLNTCNYLVHSDMFVHVMTMHKLPEEKNAADSITLMYSWLAYGNSFMVLPGMTYQHRVHPGSGFIQDAANSTRVAKARFEDIKKLFQ